MELTARNFSIYTRYKVDCHPVTTVWYEHGILKVKDAMVVVYIKEGKWYYDNSHKRVRNIFLLKLLNAEHWHLLLKGL